MNEENNEEEIEIASPRSLVSLFFAFVSRPEETWQEIRVNSSSGNKSDFLNYYIPVLLLSLVASYAGQIMFGIGIQGEKLFPEQFALFLQLIAQFFFLLFMPFLLAKPLCYIAKRYNEKVSIGLLRQFIVFAYFPILFVSIFQFLPIINGICLLFVFYGAYIGYLGIKEMLEIPGRGQGALFFFGLILFFIYMLIMGIFIYQFLPLPYPEILSLLKES